SMKPGAATVPRASMTRSAWVLPRSPMSSIRSPTTRMSPTYLSAPVPSTIVAPLISVLVFMCTRAPSSATWVSGAAGLPVMGVEQVSDAVAKQVQSQNRPEDRQAGENGEPRSALYVNTPFAEDGSPSGNVRRYAHTQEGQTCLAQN